MNSATCRLFFASVMARALNGPREIFYTVREKQRHFLFIAFFLRLDQMSPMETLVIIASVILSRAASLRTGTGIGAALQPEPANHLQAANLSSLVSTQQQLTWSAPDQVKNLIEANEEANRVVSAAARGQISNTRPLAALLVGVVWAAASALFLCGQQDKQTSSAEFLEVKGDALPYHDMSYSKPSWNTINMYVGVGLWSLPYSLMVGGWLGLILLLVLLALCWWSAVLLLKLHDQIVPAKGALPAQGEVGAYLGLAEYALGGSTGRIAAGVFLFGEFFGTSIVLVLTLWDTASRAFRLPYAMSAAFSSLMLLPFLWRGRWDHVAYINALALIATAAVTAFAVSSAVGGGLSEASTTLLRPQPTLAGTVACAGLQMVALGSGTPAVVSIYAQSPHGKDEFINGVLLPSLLCVGLLCGLMAAGGYATYGHDTQILIVDNMSNGSGIGFAISLLVAVASFATTPPFIALTTEIPIALARNEASATQLRGLRYVMLVLTVSACVVFKPYLDAVLEVTGIVCMSVTAIALPHLMALRVFGRQLSILHVVASVTAVASSAITTVAYFVYVQRE